MRHTLLISIVTLFFSSVLFAATPLTTTITGVFGEALENAQKRTEQILKTHKSSLSATEAERLFEQLKLEIQDSLKPYGYFKPDVQGELFNRQGAWRANYRIRPGPRVFIESVYVQILGEGQTDPQFIELKANFALKQNNPLITPEYNKAKQQLLDLAASRGYFDARLDQSEVKVDLEHMRATIRLILNSGQRYRYGDVRFLQKNDGAKRLSFRFLSRFVTFKKNDYFSQNDLFKLQDQLQASHYFDQVAITPQPQNATNLQVPIVIKLDASKSKRYQFGAGVGTDSGVRGLAAVTFRRLSADGHYAELISKGSAKQGSLNGKITTSYNIPGFNPTTDLHKFIIEAEREEENDYGMSHNAKIGYSYITELLGWQQNLGIRYQFEESKPIDEIPFSSNLLIPSASWLRVKSDDPIKPNVGYKIVFNARGASSKLLSDTSFIQGSVSAKSLTTFFDNTRLIARTDLGMVGIKNIEDLPLSLRFSAGGTQTIRGYGFKDIKDGRTMSIASIELQQRIYHDLYGCAFFDVGDIGQSFFTHTKRGAGAGLMWRSPIGSISLTIAQAIDKPGNPRRIEFSMGPDL